LRIAKRIGAVSVAIAASAGLMLNGTLPALAAVNPTGFVAGPTVSSSGCEVGLMLTRPSASTLPRVAAEVDSTHPGHVCTGWVERSSTAGKTVWVVQSAKVSLPSVSGLQGFANTGLVADGPGWKARACVQAAGSKTVSCTSVVSLAKGSGTATSPALTASYVRKQALVIRASGTSLLGACVGVLASSTTTKKTGTTVLAALDSEADLCTAWIQTTANGGKTWTKSPVVSYRSPNVNTDVLAFTAHYADGPGILTRLCVKDMASNKQNCSATW